MPFTYRDKPNLAYRLRGKSGEEILNELKSDFDSQGRRMFFDSPPWRTRRANSEFPRGFPFDDDRNRINIRNYLDEIAFRHPEFADQLKERPWQKDFADPSLKKPATELPCNRENEPSGSNQQPQSSTCKEEPHAQNLTTFGLRNTVPLGAKANSEPNRHQRSMSEPPENRGANTNKRFVTKCEIPVMNNPTQEPVQMKPDLTGRGSQEPPQQKANNAPNVRVIPIQVEGRDTPLVNTNIDIATNFAGETFMEPTFEGRLPRDFGSYQRHSPRFAHKERAPTPPQYQYAPQYQQYVPPSQHFMPAQQPQFASQQNFLPPEQHLFTPQQHPQKPPTPQQHQSLGPKIPQGDEPDSKTPQPKPEPVKDPMEKVEAIQKEVEELMRQVEAFKGNSRTDKQYLMLDELLTRQLLLLDVIDTEGKENVRQARKDTIKSIQKCISKLENKVPLLENSGAASELNQEQTAMVTGVPQPTNIDNTMESSPVDNKDSQKMEVDEEGNSEIQQEKPLEVQNQEKQQQNQQEQTKQENTEKI